MSFFTRTEAIQDQFYRIPKEFFKNPYYKSMSDKSKMVYSILQDRHELSLLNNWVDSEDRIYFIFSQKDLSDLTGYSLPTVGKVIKELEEKDLIFRRKFGLNKVDHMYLKKVKVEAPAAAPEVVEEDQKNASKPDEIRESKNFISGDKNSLNQEINNFYSNDNNINNTNYIDNNLSINHTKDKEKYPYCRSLDKIDRDRLIDITQTITFNSFTRKEMLGFVEAAKGDLDIIELTYNRIMAELVYSDEKIKIKNLGAYMATSIKNAFLENEIFLDL